MEHHPPRKGIVILKKSHKTSSCNYRWGLVHKIYIDSCEIRPAMQRGQQKSSAHGPSAMQPFYVTFLPACLSQSCHLPKPILQWLVFPSPPFCFFATGLCSWGTARSQLQDGELCYPTTNPDWKLRENCTQTGKLLQKSSTVMTKISQTMCGVHACTREGKKQFLEKMIEYLKQFHGKNLLPLSSKGDIMFKWILC